MTKRKKILRIFIIGVGAFLVFLLALQIILPKLINVESIKGKILAIAAEKVDGEVECGEVALSLFPYPHAVMNQVSLSIPGEVRGSLNALSVYSRILPLLKGSIQITEVILESPEFKVALPKRRTKKPEKELPASSLDIPTLATQILAPLASEVPNLEVRIKNGRLDLSQENETLFSFKSIDARILLPPKGLRIRISCDSNLWEGMEMESTLNATDYRGEVGIELDNFQPHRLASYLFEDYHMKLTDSSLDMSVELKLDGINDVQAKAQGSVPLLSFRQGNENRVIRGKSLESTFRLNEDGIKFSLDKLNLDFPKMSMSGNLLVERRPPRVKAELEGRDVDVPGIREVALSLAGDVPVVQEIFGIVRGGKVPLITVSSEGSTYDHLGDIKNIFIKGHIFEGEILVPHVELDLADVKGEVVISEGFLQGKDLEARLGNSWGREGRLKLGLANDDPTFHLDLGVQADLEELSPILKLLLDDESLKKEWNLVEGLKGAAAGRLVLGETTESVNVRVDVSKLDLSAKYQRIPYPIVISEGEFSFDETRVAVRNLKGKLGESSFSQLTAGLDLKKEPLLEITSGTIDAFLDEIHPWIISIEGFPVSPEELRGLKGTASLTSVYYKGPLLKAGDFSIEATGEFKDVVVDSALLPYPVKVIKASFHSIANPTAQEGTVNHAQISFSDASLHVSGGIEDYFKGLTHAEITFEGNVGPEFTAWVSHLAHLPPELHLRAPLSVSDGHLDWEKDTKTSFKGDLFVHDGPEGSVDLLQNSQGLAMKYSVKDKVSDASARLALRKKEIDLEFKGNVKKETFNDLFVKSGFFHGWLEGDFRAYISLDDDRKSKAEGHLRGEDLIFPWELGIPLEIDELSLKAEERHVDVERATLVSGSHQMDLEGSLEFSPPGLVMNMDVKSNGISWTDIEGLLGEGGKENELEQGRASWDLPLQGTVNLESEYFKYEPFTWVPFHANIMFAENEINIDVIEAELCNVLTPGTLKITPDVLELDFQPTAKDQEIKTTIQCYGGETVEQIGNFDLEGQVKAQCKPEDLLESLQGHFEYLAEEGRVHRHVPMEKLFAYLNVLGIAQGQLAEMRKDGFAYHSMSAKADIKDGKIVIQEGIIDGLSMDIAARGDIDFVNKTLDLVVLAAPLKTLDTVLEYIPIVRRLTKGGLVTVAAKMEGDWADPKVTTYPSSSVGSNLLKMMEETVKSPFQVIDLAPTEEAEDKEIEPNEAD